MGVATRPVAGLRAAARARLVRPLRRRPCRARLRRRRPDRLGDPLRGRLVRAVDRPLPRLPHRAVLRPGALPRGDHLHRRHPADRPALLRVPLGAGRPQRGRRRPGLRPPALAGAVDLGPGQRQGARAGRAVRHRALRPRLRPGDRPDGGPGARVLRLRILPDPGAHLRGPPAPQDGAARAAGAAAVPAAAGAGLRRAAGAGVPGAARRGAPDARGGGRSHADGARPDAHRRDPGSRGRTRRLRTAAAGFP